MHTDSQSRASTRPMNSGDCRQGTARLPPNAARSPCSSSPLSIWMMARIQRAGTAKTIEGFLDYFRKPIG
jgi:hypothetical protein